MMNDLISRQAAIEAIRASTQKYTGFMEMEMYTDDDAVEAIINLPSAQPERKRGEWIVWGGMDVPENHGRHKCSECGEFALLRYEKPLQKEVLSDFCPNCGAYMRG